MLFHINPYKWDKRNHKEQSLKTFRAVCARYDFSHPTYMWHSSGFIKISIQHQQRPFILYKAKQFNVKLNLHFMVHFHTNS